MTTHPTNETTTDRRTGTVLGGRWKLGHLLGSGGTADVYAATHVELGRAAAVKILHEAHRDGTVRERFVREGRLANQIRHPSIVDVFDDGVTDDGSAYLVMERVEGVTLDALLRTRQTGIGVADAVTRVLELLDVLAAAHDAGVVHRDVKPSNVMISHRGELKLLDLGIAGRAERGVVDEARTGLGIGTALYMAPEQLTGDRPIDGRADLWAVGIVLHLLVTGRHAFDARTVFTYLDACRRGPSLAFNLPCPVAAIIARALARDPHDRWADARSMASALRHAALGLEAPASRLAEPPMTEDTVALTTLPFLRAAVPATSEPPPPAACPVGVSPCVPSFAFAHSPGRGAPPPPLPSPFLSPGFVLGLLLFSSIVFATSLVSAWPVLASY